MLRLTIGGDLPIRKKASLTRLVLIGNTLVNWDGVKTTNWQKEWVFENKLQDRRKRGFGVR